MHFLNLTLGIRFEPVLGGLSRLKEIAPYTSMQMVSSNENNIVYPNSMKIDQWDEIYPDDKIYIRPEDGKNSVLWMAFFIQSTQFTHYLRHQKMGK